MEILQVERQEFGVELPEKMTALPTQSPHRKKIAMSSSLGERAFSHIFLRCCHSTNPIAA